MWPTDAGPHSVFSFEFTQEAGCQQRNLKLSPDSSLPALHLDLAAGQLQQCEMRENSQNHWMVEIERDFCRSSGLTALFTVGHLEQAAKDCVQMAFKYLQGWRYLNIPTISLGNQCQCSISITVHPECANSLSNLSRNRNLWQSRSRLGKATLK